MVHITSGTIQLLEVFVFEALKNCPQLFLKTTIHSLLHASCDSYNISVLHALQELTEYMWMLVKICSQK